MGAGEGVVAAVVVCGGVGWGGGSQWGLCVYFEQCL